MGKDLKYKGVKIALKSDELKSCQDIYKVVSKTTLARALGYHPGKVEKMLDAPWTISILDLYRIANLLNMPPEAFISLVRPQMPKEFYEDSDPGSESIGNQIDKTDDH